MKTKDLIICSLFSAIIAILAQISIPLPGGVPLTMQTLGVILTGLILGGKRGFTSISVYILIGSIGLPVFSNFTCGINIIVGPTGGFILSFPFIALIVGLISEKSKNKYTLFIGTTIALMVSYLFGAIQFALVSNTSFTQALLITVAPFIIVDAIKAILAIILGLYIKEHRAIRSVMQ